MLYTIYDIYIYIKIEKLQFILEIVNEWMQTWSFCQPQKAEHNHKEGCLCPLDAPGQRALAAAAEGLLTLYIIY